MVIAAASFASPVMAADITTTPAQVLDMVGTSAFFGDSFAENNMGNTFADHFNFSVTGAPANFDAIVSSISRAASTGLDITGLSLYSSTNTLISTGTSLQSGAIDVWTLTSDNLAAGDYYVQVSGTMVSQTSGSFGGAVSLAPVPEPETYGMMLGGLGILGFLARRRKQKPE